MKLVYPEGATPIDEDAADALIPTHITTVRDLNQWESQNIQNAAKAVLSRKRRKVLTAGFVRKLHRSMFDKTWKWAGKFRTTETNLGAPPEQIATRVHDLLANAEHWIEEGVFPLREVAARLHHGLVAIHPFVNGNGRHARLLADVLLFSHGERRIDWGGEDIDEEGEVRRDYLGALRAAGVGDFGPLLAYL